jgi:hypothetical protein
MNNPMNDVDTGTIADVPEKERMSVDQGPGANALEGGDDSSAAERAFDDPGEVRLLGGKP